MAVPPHYDLVNRVLTWGQDERWRRQAARECLRGNPQRLLDIGCGTGDLAVRLAGRQGQSVIALDYSLPMLELARRKAEAATVSDRVHLVHGDVANLPFPDDYFDCVGIAFAFRNLTYKNPYARRYLQEVYRVLRPGGGRFVIVESSQPHHRLVRLFFRLYLRWFVYPVGRLISGNRTAYRYLAESAARFYTPSELAGILAGVGFSRFTSRPYLFGAAAVQVAVKGD